MHWKLKFLCVVLGSADCLEMVHVALNNEQSLGGRVPCAQRKGQSWQPWNRWVKVRGSRFKSPFYISIMLVGPIMNISAQETRPSRRKAQPPRSGKVLASPAGHRAKG